MIVRILSYFKGFVQIYASGYFLERFLNLLRAEDIILLELERPTQEELCARISISDFKLIRKAARKTRTKVKITSRHGFPFFIKKNQNRRGFFIGTILFLMLIWYLSSHLMGIHIEGNNKLSEKALLSALNSYGVKIGTPIDSINTKFLKNQLMTSLDDLGWVGLNLKGSRLYITLTERKEKETIPDTKDPCNLVAKKDGVIRLMEIRDGQTMVLKDTLVKEGDLLVSGVIDSKSVGMRYTHSYGEIFATTWYKEEIDIPLKYKAKIFTGKKKTKRKLNFLNFSVPLYLKEKPAFNLYQKKKSEKEFSLPLKIFPSLIIEKMDFYEQKEENKERTVSEAVVLGKFHLLERVNKELSENGKIEKADITYKEYDGFITVTLECECYEDIAVKTPIDKTDELEYNENNY